MSSILRYISIRPLAILVIILVFIGAGVLAFVQSNAANAAVLVPILTPPAAPDPYVSYRPSTYGIPDFIAGYHVLIIKTPDNTACFPPQARMAVLEIPEARDQTSDEMIATFDTEAVHQALKEFAGEWRLEIMGGKASFEEIVSQEAAWNTEMERTGCIRLGPIDTESLTVYKP